MLKSLFRKKLRHNNLSIIKSNTQDTFNMVWHLYFIIKACSIKKSGIIFSLAYTVKVVSLLYPRSQVDVKLTRFDYYQCHSWSCAKNSEQLSKLPAQFAQCYVSTCYCSGMTFSYHFNFVEYTSQNIFKT